MYTHILIIETLTRRTLLKASIFFMNKENSVIAMEFIVLPCYSVIEDVI